MAMFIPAANFWLDLARLGKITSFIINHYLRSNQVGMVMDGTFATREAACSHLLARHTWAEAQVTDASKVVFRATTAFQRAYLSVGLASTQTIINI
jgi:hypothetical protein